jgi:hypothetical protein
MGSVLERSLRAEGLDINVRQYGWFGADIPKYVLVAPEVVHLWDPSWVVVVITANDLGPNLLTGGERLVRQPDGRWGALSSTPSTAGFFRRASEPALHRSRLLYHLAKRAQEAGVPIIRARNGWRDGVASIRPGGLPLAERARVAVAALRDAYGSRLRILFAADVGVSGLKEKSPAEEAMLAACAETGVRCADTRERMIKDRQASLRLSRGFMNSVPGAGHLNSTGHAIAAATILQDLAAPQSVLTHLPEQDR